MSSNVKQDHAASTLLPMSEAATSVLLSPMWRIVCGNISFPREYHAELVGEYAERATAQNRLLVLASIAAMGIFVLLQASFGSWRLAILAFLSLPVALVGGVLAAFAGGGVISLGSLVGFLTVLGIAARNGILLINHYQHLEAIESERFGPDLVMRGGPRAAFSDLDDDVGNGSGTGTARNPWRTAGPRNRASHGRCYTRGSCHFHSGEPLRGPISLSSIW